MLDVIDYKNINKYKRYFTTDLNRNSKLYYDKELLHKILLNEHNDLSIILDLLNKLNLKELVEVRNLICSDDIILGYSMKNYKEYRSLNNFNNRNLDLKKEDCFKIVKVHQKLLKYNLIYTDYHKGNILLNPNSNDIKICDLDSLIFNKENSSIKNLLIFILSYLYNIKYNHIRNIVLSNFDADSTFIEYELKGIKNIDCNKILELINNIDYRDIEEDKEIIISRSKELIKTGYNKFC